MIIRTERRRELMDTCCRILVSHPPGLDNRVEGAIESAFAEMERVERLLSRYQHSSEIFRINSGSPPDRLSSDTVRILIRAEYMKRHTYHCFDHRDEGRIDLGGIAKGTAIDRGVAVLRQEGFDDFLVDAGGDIYASGTSAGKSWRLDISQPSEDRPLMILALRDCAVAVSGTMHRGEHIRRSKKNHQSLLAGAVGPETEVADALATAVFAAGPDHLEFLCNFPEYEFFLLDEVDAVHYSPSLLARIMPME
jgi:FAD:protein FMN transferase